jgi:hypothetical protein
MYAILVWRSLIPLVDVDMMCTDESDEEQIQTYHPVNRMDEAAINITLACTSRMTTGFTLPPFERSTSHRDMEQIHTA